jgi:hypothetical protein
LSTSKRPKDLCTFSAWTIGWTIGWTIINH